MSLLLRLVVPLTLWMLNACGGPAPEDPRREVDSVPAPVAPAMVGESERARSDTVHAGSDTQPVRADVADTAGPEDEVVGASRTAGLAPGAYVACRDSLTQTLPDPQAAVWPARPDTVQPLPEGRFRLLGQVRPDSVSPGLTYFCVVRRTGADGWEIIDLGSSSE